MTSPGSKPEPPNFDGMSHDELWEFWKEHQRGWGVKKLPGFSRKTTASFAAYACNKAVAMKCRQEGDITAASTYERICEDIYGRLPKEARW